MTHPKVVYKFKYTEGTQTFKHKIVKKSTFVGDTDGTACSTSLTPWADSGQNVKITVKVEGVGKISQTFVTE